MSDRIKSFTPEDVVKKAEHTENEGWIPKAFEILEKLNAGDSIVGYFTGVTESLKAPSKHEPIRKMKSGLYQQVRRNRPEGKNIWSRTIWLDGGEESEIESGYWLLFSYNEIFVY